MCKLHCLLSLFGCFVSIYTQKNYLKKALNLGFFGHSHVGSLFTKIVLRVVRSGHETKSEIGHSIDLGSADGKQGWNMQK